jgi:hypothetical protein
LQSGKSSILLNGVPWKVDYLPQRPAAR